MRILCLALGLLFAFPAFSSHSRIPNALSPGRVVIFADVKEGDLKTDLTLKKGTRETLDRLFDLGTREGVHSCYRGSPESVKSIFMEMIEKSKRTGQNFQMNFSTSTASDDHPSIHVEISSGKDENQPFTMSIDPC